MPFEDVMSKPAVSFGVNGDDWTGQITELKLLYSSMMNHLAELIVVLSRLHACGAHNVNFEQEMGAVFEEIRQVEQFATSMRSRVREMEKRAGPHSLNP